MKSYSSRELIKILENDGWYFVGCVGDHWQFKHPTKKGRITVTHPKKDIPIKTSWGRVSLTSAPLHYYLKMGGSKMSQKNRYSFIAVFHYADDGISISFPDLEGCYPCAETEEEAFKNVKEALGLHLWGMEQDNESIPKPTPLKDIKLEECEIPVMVDVFMPPVRERVNNKFVKKTLSLPAWLAALADKDGINCSKIFQNALIDYLGVDISTKQPLNK